MFGISKARFGFILDFEGLRAILGNGFVFSEYFSLMGSEGKRFVM